MSDKIVIAKEMEIGEIIALKGRKAEKIIEDYFFDFKKLSPRDKMITLEKAARKSGKDYKLLAVLRAVNDLPEKIKK